ncbi:internalin [Bacillus wiedmannii]|uniref:internalin n=1 Tax=Bacillus wiedmannii TaxID=1890302 RepID=UPI000BEDA946|nr:internalin [Bacillus wiedmannii]PEF37656.1 internalin [Bacillus wiedmannii]
MFPIGEQPRIIKDLENVTANLEELAIEGKTKNIERLASLHVKKLWIFAVNQKQFEHILLYARPDILYVYEMRVEDLSGLQKLSDLQQLYMCWNTKAKTLWDIEYNKKLKSLLIDDFSKLDDLSALSKCPQLNTFYMGGGINTAMKVQTLQPLAALQHLKKLTLMNLKVKDDSLEPLIQLKNLRELSLSNQFKVEEYAKLSVALPYTECEFFKPCVYMNDAIEGKNIMVIGRRRPLLNLKMDTVKIQKYEEQFKKLQEEYKALVEGTM